MRKTILMLLLTGACTLASAQVNRQISGYVIDKKTGNPLPGATVEAKGGAETTTTDMDGSYTIEVSRFLKKLQATYAGMEPQSIKLKEGNEAIFRLKPEKKHRWFLGLNYGRGGGGSEFISSSFFFGQTGNWGWYARYGGEYAVDGDDSKLGLTLTGGAIKQIKGEHFAYFGGGLGRSFKEKEAPSGYWGYYKEIHNNPAFALEGGYIWRHKHFFLDAGPSLRIGSSVSFAIYFGAGYAF